MDGMCTGQLLERQKKLGLVSEDAEMVDWPDVLPEWDSFSEEGKKYLAQADGGQCRFPGTC
jgi:hypothetical protein